MPRRTSTPPAPKWTEPTDTSKETITLQLQVITPMFGGGYEARRLDPFCPIRAASVRGHLRFWWRATKGTNYLSPTELFAAEEKLWGSATQHSVEDKSDAPSVDRIALRISVTDPGREVTLSEVAPKATPIQGPQEGYFLFPFQAQKDGTPEATGTQGIAFTLQLTVSTQQHAEVEQALCAWIAFGGIGARVRRGCGALTVSSDSSKWLPPVNSPDFSQWATALYGSSLQSTSYTVLSNCSVVLGAPCRNALQAWREVGRFWSRFRKGHVGSITYEPMLGARWRDYRGALLGYNDLQAPTIALTKPYLGLPIVYQRFNTAPYAPRLDADGSGRMASPVILKPLAFADGSFRPLVAVLNAPPPTKVKIDSVEVSLRLPANDPVLAELKVTDPLEGVIRAAEILWDTKRLKPEMHP